METNNPLIHWEGQAEQRAAPVCTSRRAYKDPTADRAIANVMREERQKRKPPSRSAIKPDHQRKEENCMRENEVESAFVSAVKNVGGQALKFTSQTMNGVPDRLVLLIGGKCAFVELKAPGKQMRLLQRKRRYQLQALGFPVFCVDRLEQIEPVITALQSWRPGEPIPTGVGAEIPEIDTVTLPSGN